MGTIVQQMIVTVLVAWATYHVTWRAWRTVKAVKTKRCTGCRSGCTDGSHPAPTLFSIELPERRKSAGGE